MDFFVNPKFLCQLCASSHPVRRGDGKATGGDRVGDGVISQAMGAIRQVGMHD